MNNLFINKDYYTITLLLKKTNLMCIAATGYNGKLYSKLYFHNEPVQYVALKPSKVINMICKGHLHLSYEDCAQITKNYINTHKKSVVCLFDPNLTVWIPLSSTQRDHDNCVWLNNNYCQRDIFYFSSTIRTSEKKQTKIHFTDGQHTTVLTSEIILYRQWCHCSNLLNEIRLDSAAKIPMFSNKTAANHIKEPDEAYYLTNNIETLKHLAKLAKTKK